MVICLDFLKNGFDFKAFYVLKKSGVAVNYCRVINCPLGGHLVKMRQKPSLRA
jgi:hypothetical protein